jgi:hypothetical protein
MVSNCNFWGKMGWPVDGLTELIVVDQLTS